MWVCLCVGVGVSVYACVRLFDVCLAFSVMLNGITKVATPLLASSSHEFFNSKYLFFYSCHFLMNLQLHRLLLGYISRWRLQC